LADSIKVWIEIAQFAAYLAAGASAVGAMCAYRRNARLERAKWAVSLYEKFYEGANYKAVRDLLDCAETGAGAEDIARLVEAEPSGFTD